MTSELLKTPLYDAHMSLGARMVEFAGWSMPLCFAGILEEHAHTRTACSVFDVSHMGRLRVSGPDAERFLDMLCTRNLQGADCGRSYYTHMCKDDGGILDDLIVSRFEEHWSVVCNASNRAKIVAWIDAQQTRLGWDVSIEDQTTSTAMLALQGPKTIALAEEMTHLDLSTLKRYRFLVREYLAAEVIIARSGYTGEDGLEIIAPATMLKFMVPYLLGTAEKPHKIIRPAGLGARDTLRIEAAMPLYGHELSEDVDTLTAGQGWCVDLAKEFIGAEAMRRCESAGIPRRLVGLELEGKRIARQHYRVFASDDDVGEITSGTLSPTLGKSIAMAQVGASHADVDTELQVDLRGNRVPARVVKLPFYKRPR